MVLLNIICLLLMINCGENLEISEANMHFDGNNTSIGILTLLQRDANHSLRIVGVLRVLQSRVLFT